MQKNHALPAILTCGILGVLLGVLLLVLDFSKIVSILFIIIGIITLIANLPAFIFALTSINPVGIITSAFPILAGVLMIFWQNTVLLCLVGAYLIILPVIRILLARDRSNHLRLELPRLIIGILLLLIGPGTAFNALFNVAGYVIIALSVLFTALGIAKLYRR